MSLYLASANLLATNTGLLNTSIRPNPWANKCMTEPKSEIKIALTKVSLRKGELKTSAGCGLFKFSRKAFLQSKSRKVDENSNTAVVIKAIELGLTGTSNKTTSGKKV